MKDEDKATCIQTAIFLSAVLIAVSIICISMLKLEEIRNKNPGYNPTPYQNR